MQPAVSESGFFVRRADLKREALIGKKKFYGVIETILYHMSLRPSGSNLDSSPRMRLPLAMTIKKEKMTTEFTSLHLREELVQAITELGYSEPTPIQAAIIPMMLKGADVIGQAQTGTGKTAAFAFPILQ